MRTLLQSTCFAVLLAGAGSAAGYDQAGHFYTVQALVRTATVVMPDSDRRLLAVCAQLPDMASDLDATALYFRAVTHSPWAWFRWATADKVDRDDIGRLVTVQRLLHALTGGLSLATQNVAIDKAKAWRDGYKPDAPIRERAVNLCAWGFSLHFLADALAHEKLDDAAVDREKRHLYDTGKGHAFDMHDPDYVLCAERVPLTGTAVTCNFTTDANRRFAAWQNLWSKDSTNFLDGSFMPAPGRQALLAQIVSLGKDASSTNHWGEEKMREALARDDPALKGIGAFIDAQAGDQKPCRTVLARALATLQDLAPFGGLRCEAVWAAYRQSMKGALKDDMFEAKGYYIDTPLMLPQAP